MPTVGAPVPVGDDWIARRFKALEDEIRKLRTARSGDFTTITGELRVEGTESVTGTLDVGGDATFGGSVDVSSGGTIRVLDGSGNLVVIAGLVPISGHTGFATARPDGSVSFQSDNSGFTGLFDKGEQVIFSDDAPSGNGIARPHLSMSAMINTNVSTWPSTTSGAFTSIAGCYIERQNAVVSWTIGIAAEAGTTGQLRLMCNGTQIGSTQTVTGGSIAFWSDDQPWPSGVAMFTDVFLSLEARATSGSGFVWGQCYRLKGNQS